MTKRLLLLNAWVPDVIRTRLASEFPEVEAIDTRERSALENHLPHAEIMYGAPAISLLPQAASLRWIQLSSAGVALDFCDVLKGRNVRVTNLSGLYGPTIAEHALALMLMLARNLHRVVYQQQQGVWQRDVAKTMVDLAGKTAAIVALGNIGQSIARLCRAFGMRVLGCRRTPRPTPAVDHLYELGELSAMLGEADFVVVAAPLTRETDGMLGPEQFAAMKKGAFYVNLSRGRVAQEEALLAALQSGRIAGAGMDAYAVEPLPAGHSFWSLPQVIVSPHYSGETVNLSAQPGELFLRNLRAYLDGGPIGHLVDLALSY